MGKIDQFESVFRSSLHDVYEYQPICFNNVLIITDLQAQAMDDFVAQVKGFADPRSMCSEENCAEENWQYLSQNDFNSTEELLSQVKRIQPDLIFTYRNLHSKAWKFPHSLGEHLDVLIQQTSVPIFILPHPHADYALDHSMQNCDVVMALTDHLSNDHDLVNHAIRFTQKEGVLYLGHIEDKETFERYMDAISRIQSINTEDAQNKLSKELLKLPKQYINSVVTRMQQEKLPLEIKADVRFGHHLTEFKQCIKDYKVDLFVLNAKEHQQMAMHGLAYPLAVELRQIPLLML